jgi:hypothetical protein
MKIGILSSNNSTSRIEELEKSKLASNRLRLAVVKDAASSMGYEIPALDFYNNKEQTDILIIGKYVHKSGANLFLDDDGSRMNRWLNYIIFAKKNRTKIVLDYTDHLIEVTDERSLFYKYILELVDLIIVPSVKMKKNIEKYYKGKIDIIEEPLEVNILSFKDHNFDKINALWFGHTTNLIYLFNYIKKNRMIDDLKIVTSELNERDKKAIRELNVELKVDFFTWEPNFYDKYDLNCNVCLIPSNLDDARKNGVSNNRLITSFALGLVPIATLVESYSEFSEYIINIDNEYGINKQSLLNLKAKLSTNQKEIVSAYSLTNIKNKWIEIISL